MSNNKLGDTAILDKLIKNIDQHCVIASELRAEGKHMEYVLELAKIQGLLTFVTKEVSIITTGISSEYGIATSLLLGHSAPSHDGNSEISKLMETLGIGPAPKTPSDKN